MSTYPDDPPIHVAHEMIYKALYVQARGVFKCSLVEHCAGAQAIGDYPLRPIRNWKTRNPDCHACQAVVAPRSAYPRVGGGLDNRHRRCCYVTNLNQLIEAA